MHGYLLNNEINFLLSRQKPFCIHMALLIEEWAQQLYGW